MNKEEEKYLFWLCSIHGIGLSAIRRVMERFRTAEEIFVAPEEQIRCAGGLKKQEQERILKAKKGKSWEEEWEKIGEKGIRFLSFFHEKYPESLRNLYQPPKKLMVKGMLRIPTGFRLEL